MNEIYILGTELITNDVRSYSELDDCHSKNFLENQSNKNIYRCRNNTDLTNYFGLRYEKKIDRSVQYALYATESLLKKTKLPNKYCDKTGISLGNNYASWAYVENQMYGLYKGDSNAINPYVATAWFPAAAQGEISIRNKLYGHSKTFSLDQLSSAVALEYAMDLLITNKLNYVITGGYESLVSPLIVASLQADNLISESYPASEAASMLLLSNQPHEKDKAQATIIYLNKGSNLNYLLHDLKQKFKLNTIDYCILPPLNLADDSKKSHLKIEIDTLLKFDNKLLIGMPTFFYGEVCGASFALQVTTALWMLDKQTFPYNYLMNLSIRTLNEIDNRYKKPLSIILIIGRDYYADDYFVLVLRKTHEST